MQLLYNGIDITEQVQVAEAVSVDSEGGQADMLKLTLENAAQWQKWSPKADDMIVLIDDGYTTGSMYIDTLVPDGDGFKIIACSLPSAARQVAWASYEQVTLGELIRQACAEAGTDFTAYGVSLSGSMRRVVRRNESLPAMLDRILTWEGGRLKCAGGLMCAISLKWAQEREAVRTLTADIESGGFTHHTRDWERVRSVRVESALGRGVVRYAHAGGKDLVYGDLPATDNAQAARWASGLAASHMRDAETIKWTIDYDGQLCAWSRVDITGAQVVEGEWIAREVEHDHIERKTKLTLARTVEVL